MLLPKIVYIGFTRVTRAFFSEIDEFLGENVGKKMRKRPKLRKKVKICVMHYNLLGFY